MMGSLAFGHVCWLAALSAAFRTASHADIAQHRRENQTKAGISVLSGPQCETVFPRSLSLCFSRIDFVSVQKRRGTDLRFQKKEEIFQVGSKRFL